MGGRVAILLALVLCCSISYAEEPVEIPLKNIWGYDRARRELEPELFLKRDTPERRGEYSTPEKLQEILDKAHSSLTYQIEQAMNDDVLDLAKARAPNDRRPAAGFAVKGRPYKAWQSVHDVVVKKRQPQSTFTIDDELSVVFFALTSGAQPHLVHCELTGKKINLDYVIPSNGRLGIRPTLVIVPISRLPSGKYQVTPHRAQSLEPKYNDKGFESYGVGIEKAFVCRPFEFEVIDGSRKGKEGTK